MKTTTSVHWNKGSVAREHNSRDKILCSRESHIDLNNNHGDSYNEVWVRNDLTEKYRELFGGAIESHNVGKRKCRQLTVESYMQSIIDNKQGRRQTKKLNDGTRVIDQDSRQGKQLSYEFTVKVGNCTRLLDDNGKTIYDANGHHIHPEELPRDLQYICLKKYHEQFEEENPNFKLVNVDLHADEGFFNINGNWEYSEIHSHYEIIPISSGYSRGPDIQNSIGGALRDMGISGDDKFGVDLYSVWAEKEKTRLAEIVKQEYESYCKDHPDFAAEHGDLEIYEPIKEGIRKGDKTKELYALEHDIGEKIAILNDMKKELSAEEEDLHKQKKKQDKRDADQNRRDEEQNLRDEQQNEAQLKIAADAALLAMQREEQEEKQEELDRRDQQLNAREKELDDREVALDTRDKLQDKKEKELGRREKTIEGREKELNIVRHNKKSDGSGGSDGSGFSSGGASKPAPAQKDSQNFDPDKYQ